MFGTDWRLFAVFLFLFVSALGFCICGYGDGFPRSRFVLRHFPFVRVLCLVAMYCLARVSISWGVCCGSLRICILPRLYFTVCCLGVSILCSIMLHIFGGQVAYVSLIWRYDNSAYRLLYSMLQNGQLVSCLEIRMLWVLCCLTMCLAMFSGFSPLCEQSFILHCHVFVLSAFLASCLVLFAFMSWGDSSFCMYPNVSHIVSASPSLFCELSLPFPFLFAPEGRVFLGARGVLLIWIWGRCCWSVFRYYVFYGLVIWCLRCLA